MNQHNDKRVENIYVRDCDCYYCKKSRSREKMIVIGVAVPFLLCLLIFVVVVMRTALAHHIESDIPQVVEPAGYSYGPEIPKCDEPLWERIKDRCAGHDNEERE